MSAMIEVAHLKKSFGAKEVLKDLSFSLQKGEIYALLGSNGAGKTTTIKILATLAHQNSGFAEVGGFDVEKNPQKVQEVISLTGQFAAVDEMLTGLENLVLIGKLRHLKEPQKIAVTLLEKFGLTAAGNQLVATYSGGMKRRLDLAMSLVGSPKIIFLDEPTTGLDPESRLQVWDFIRDLKKAQVTILLTTQYIEEAEQLADRVGILKNGALIKEGTPQDLMAEVDQGVDLSFYNMADYQQAIAILQGRTLQFFPEILRLQVITTGSAEDFAQVVVDLEKAGVTFRKFGKMKNKLEDVFLKIIQEGK